MSLDAGIGGSLDKGFSRVKYETQTGTIAEPSTTPSANGHVVLLYNSTKGRYFICTRMNSAWQMVEVL